MTNIKVHFDNNLGSEGVMKPVIAQSGVRFGYSHPKLSRTIEIFRSPQDMIKLVSMFHVPAVKTLWVFDDLIMLRSYMVTMLTGVCESFDWFSNNKNPMDIMLKNAQRGYATYHNDKELRALELYMTSPANKVWGYDMISNRKLFTGIYSKDHIFFRVDQYPLGLRYGKPIIPVDQPLVTSHEPYGGVPVLKHKGDTIKFWNEGSGNQWYVSPPPVL
jgi:hypothetical protein